MQQMCAERYVQVRERRLIGPIISMIHSRLSSDFMQTNALCLFRSGLVCLLCWFGGFFNRPFLSLSVPSSRRVSCHLVFICALWEVLAGLVAPVWRLIRLISRCSNAL